MSEIAVERNRSGKTMEPREWQKNQTEAELTSAYDLFVISSESPLTAQKGFVTQVLNAGVGSTICDFCLIHGNTVQITDFIWWVIPKHCLFHFPTLWGPVILKCLIVRIHSSLNLPVTQTFFSLTSNDHLFDFG